MYLCDSHAHDPSLVHFIIVTHFTVETDDPIRPFCLNAREEFENPSFTAIGKSTPVHITGVLFK